MFVVDTNVLVYAADEDSPFHAGCRELIAQWRGSAGAWFTTWGILYEFLRVTTHAKVLRRPWEPLQAWGFVQGLLNSSTAFGFSSRSTRCRNLAEEGPSKRDKDDKGGGMPGSWLLLRSF